MVIKAIVGMFGGVGGAKSWWKKKSTSPLSLVEQKITELIELIKLSWPTPNDTTPQADIWTLINF